MATIVEMPKLGNTVEECLLTTWLKHKGDAVVAGDVIAEVETDKASFEVPAPVDGILLDTFCVEGDLVPVFTRICAIGAAGEDVQPLIMRPPQITAPRSEVAAQAPHLTAQRSQVTARAPAQPEPPAPSPGPGPTEAPAGTAPLSPRARRFAREHEFLPPGLTGSGPGGRVLEADLRDRYWTGPRISGTARAHIADGYSAPPDGSGIGGLIRSRDMLAPAARVSAVRQKIAERLRESLRSTAQYTLNSSANAAGLLAARRALKASPATAAITINDLVVFCTIRALLQAPGLNAEFADGMLRQHADVHLAFACDTDRGLLVPVVRASQRLSLTELSSRMRELAEQATAGTIGPDDLTGGTFTVSNLGNLGIESFTPVLNPPQVAILGVDAIQLKPVRKADGNVEFIDSIGLSLTVDHQVIDGVPGARFLAILAREIEQAEELCTT